MGSKKAAGDDRRARAEQMKAEREAAARAAERRSRLLVLLAVLAAVAVVVVAVVATRDSGGSGDTVADAAVPQGVEPPSGGAVLGDDDAPVVVDEWIDFACPACAAFAVALGPTLSQLVDDGDIQLVYHPLSFINEGSALAANAFGCAIDEDKASEYYDVVFANQPTEAEPFTNEQLIGFGEQVGITSPEFATCVNDGAYADWVTNVQQRGVEELPTIRTPTLFINGEEVTQLPATPEELVALVDAAASGEAPEPTP
jgi:protein-disulfide isomerase